ncbi:hypothetical protein [Streptomyces sp. NPDC052042]|uniref:hypothetical protein n=1 Tax=Streptomyces sp. NPDC052042 TaxID=3365683 RepID=UPI0037D33F73
MILTRGARITGAVLCALLAAIVAGWIVRDLGAVAEPGQLLRYWAGFEDARLPAMPAASTVDVALFVVYVVVALVVPRSTVAASALVATGVLTLAFRLPGLWNIGTSRMGHQYSDELRTRALICAFVAVGAAIAMLITAGAGRRPPADLAERVPVRPGQGAGALAFLLLGASAAVRAAWEIWQLVKNPGLFPDWYLGGDLAFRGLIDPPQGWTSAFVVLLCLFAGVSALARAPHARPFGLIAAGILLPSAASLLNRSLDSGVLERFGELSVEHQLLVLSWTFELIAGAAVLVVLAVRGPADVSVPPYQGYEPEYGQDHGHPGPDPGQGYGYPGSGPGEGYGYPASGPGPGNGHPGSDPGAFGPHPPHQPPPPPSQPPPGW